MILTEYICLQKYGRDFLDEDEFEQRKAQIEKSFHRELGEAVLRRQPKKYWDFQNFALGEIGVSISHRNKIVWAVQAALNLALNPKQTIERLIRYRKQQLPTQKIDEYVDI